MQNAFIDQTFASARGGDPVARVEALTAAAIAVAGFVLLCRIVVKTTGRASEERSLPKPDSAGEIVACASRLTRA